MKAPVAVLERVDVDEAEGEAGSRQNRVEPRGDIAVECFEPGDQRGQVFMPGADVIGQGGAGRAVVLSNEATLLPQAQMHEAGIADDDTLQAFQLCLIDRMPPGFTDDLAPAPDAILGRVLAFDLETRP